MAWIHKVPNIGLRFFNVYGPKDLSNLRSYDFISTAISKCIQKRPITIHGDGMHTRDFIYVQDIVRGLLASMSALQQAPMHKIFNLCSNKESSLIDILNILENISGYKIVRQFMEANPSSILRSCGDNAKIRAELGLNHFTSLEQGLRETWQAMQNT